MEQPPQTGGGPRRSARLKCLEKEGVGNVDLKYETKVAEKDVSRGCNVACNVEGNGVVRDVKVGLQGVEGRLVKGKRKGMKGEAVSDDMQEGSGMRLECTEGGKFTVYEEGRQENEINRRKVADIARKTETLVDRQKGETNHIDQTIVRKLDEMKRGTADAEKQARKRKRGHAKESNFKEKIVRLQSCNKTALITHSTDGPRSLGVLDPSHIQSVKSALHLSTVPDIVLCREPEQNKIVDFCKSCIQMQQAGSLYICGCPGTGKTLIMEKVKLQVDKWAEEVGICAPLVLSLNCTSLTNSWDIFRRISQMLSPGQENKASQSNNTLLVNAVKHDLCKVAKAGKGYYRRMLLLIVDEMDYLISKNQLVLYELFGLCVHANSRCILIGIANAIDLTDRFLPKLQSLNCKPDVVIFSSYTKDQVLILMNQRLKVFPDAVFHPAALELCARKVAAASGDMRKALHLCRTALDIVEEEMQKGVDEEMEDGDASYLSPNSGQSEVGQGQANGVKQNQYSVHIHHMAEALGKTYRSTSVETVRCLPKHQQMVLCAAVRLFRQGKKDASLAQLNSAYLEFCKSSDIHGLSVLEFSNLCRVLADQGILNLGFSREDRMRRVSLQVDEEDIVFAFQGMRFFRNYLL